MGNWDGGGRGVERDVWNEMGCNRRSIRIYSVTIYHPIVSKNLLPLPHRLLLHHLPHRLNLLPPPLTNPHTNSPSTPTSPPSSPSNPPFTNKQHHIPHQRHQLRPASQPPKRRQKLHPRAHTHTLAHASATLSHSTSAGWIHRASTIHAPCASNACSSSGASARLGVRRGLVCPDG